MTPELSDDIDAALDRFEIRLRRRWAGAESRLADAHRKRLRESMDFDDPRNGIGAAKPSLDYYDAAGSLITGPSWEHRRPRRRHAE